jgi:hypothetical protein
MARRLLSTAGLLCLLPLLSNAQGRTDYFFHQFNVEIIPRVLAVHPTGRLFSCNGGSTILIDACETAQVFLWDEDFELETTFWPTLGERWSHLKTAAWHGDTLIGLGQPDYCPNSFEERDAFSYLLAYDLTGSFQDGVALPDCETGTPVFFFAERSPSISLPLLAFGPTGEIYVALDDGLLRFPSIRDWPERVAEELELGKLLGLAALPDGRLALCSADSLRLFDPATEEVQWSVPLAAQSMTVIDGLLWLASADSLHCLLADDSLLGWPLPAGVQPGLRLTAHEGRPLLHGYHRQSILPPTYRGWHFIAASETLEQAFNWGILQADIFALEPLGPDSCFVAGAMGGISRPFVKKAAFSALEFTSPYDIGVAEINAEILEVKVLHESSHHVSAHITVALEYIVENYGATRVDAFQIDWPQPSGWCNGPGRFFVSAAGLEPGDQITYQGTLHPYVIVPPAFWPPDSLTFALHTYAPNHHPDGDPTNDHATVRVLLTSAPDQPLAAPHIRLSPNPAQAMVRVESELPLEGFELYDATGRLLRQIELPGGTREFELLRASLPAGLYFLRLRSGGSLWVERLVWQD